MPPFVLIGLAAGLASAVLFASARMGNPGGRLLLFFLAPLPGFLAGLGWGPMAAVLSAVSAGIAITFLLGITGGVMLLLSQGIPVAVLCWLAQLGRPLPVPAAGLPPDPAAAPQIAAPPPIEWYPPGYMLAWAAVMAGLLGVFTAFIIGSNLDEMRQVLRELLEKVFLKQFPMFKDRTLTPAEIASLTELMLYTFPAASAVTWLAGLLLNLYLAGRITLASGRLTRQWPDLAALTFPRGFGAALAAALIGLLVLDGWPRLVASGFAGAFIFLYMLLGLAILHFVTRGVAARPFILWGVYVALFVLNTWAGLALALLGALEPLLPWRRSKRQGRPPD